MYKVVRYNNEIQVVKVDTEDKVTNIVCKIPTYYINDENIGLLISKLLEENSKKYKLEFEI